MQFIGCCVKFAVSIYQNAVCVFVCVGRQQGDRHACGGQVGKGLSHVTRTHTGRCNQLSLAHSIFSFTSTEIWLPGGWGTLGILSPLFITVANSTQLP